MGKVALRHQLRETGAESQGLLKNCCGTETGKHVPMAQMDVSPSSSQCYWNCSQTITRRAQIELQGPFRICCEKEASKPTMVTQTGKSPRSSLGGWPLLPDCSREVLGLRWGPWGSVVRQWLEILSGDSDWKVSQEIPVPSG